MNYNIIHYLIYVIIIYIFCIYSVCVLYLPILVEHLYHSLAGHEQGFSFSFRQPLVSDSSMNFSPCL